MNKVQTVYPEDYDDEDKAEYDMLVAMGKNSIGSVIGVNETYLLDLAAKMTIRERKGGLTPLTEEEVLNLKRIHNEHLEKGLIHETPSEEWYTSASNPINQPYLPPEVEEDIKENDEKIKNGWVKIVDKPNIPVINENAECDCCGA